MSADWAARVVEDDDEDRKAVSTERGEILAGGSACRPASSSLEPADGRFSIIKDMEEEAEERRART